MQGYLCVLVAEQLTNFFYIYEEGFVQNNTRLLSCKVNQFYNVLINVVIRSTP